MRADVVDGDLLDQPVDAIVNAWNRNVIPWWLLLPQGVSGAIKRRAGLGPFIEFGRAGTLALGDAVLTGPGRLPLRGIIHVAGIDLLWRASAGSICRSVQSAMTLAHRHGFASIAFPVIGAGSGGYAEAAALELMQQTLATVEWPLPVRIVRFRTQVSSRRR